MRSIALVTTFVVCLGVTLYLVGTMVRSIRNEKRRSNLKGTWKHFGLSMALMVLFFVSWAGQAVVEWQSYAEQQREHGEAATASGFVVEFGQSTLENWQSEFLQLFSFVTLAAILIHRGSAESKDSDEQVQAALKRIEQRLDELAPRKT